MTKVEVKALRALAMTWKRRAEALDRRSDTASTPVRANRLRGSAKGLMAARDELLDWVRANEFGKE